MTDLSPMQTIVFEKEELRRKLLSFISREIQHYCQDFTRKTGAPVNNITFGFRASHTISSENPKANILTDVDINIERF